MNLNPKKYNNDIQMVDFLLNNCRNHPQKKKLRSLVWHKDSKDFKLIDDKSTVENSEVNNMPKTKLFDWKLPISEKKKSKKQNIIDLEIANFKPKRRHTLIKNYFCNCENLFKQLWINKDNKDFCYKTLDWIKKSNQMNSIYVKNNRRLVNSIDLDLVKKDFKRTFKKISDLNNNEILEELVEITTKICYENDTFSYVQGMSFIISSIRYHCNKKNTIKLVNFLFKFLKMNLVYNYFEWHIKSFIKILKNILKINNIDIYNKLKKLDFNYEILLIEWLFTLGFIKIPLNSNYKHIEYLIKNGWDYFFKLIIQYILMKKEQIIKINCSIDLIALIKSNNTNSKENIDYEYIIDNCLALKSNIKKFKFLN